MLMPGVGKVVGTLGGQTVAKGANVAVLRPGDGVINNNGRRPPMGGAATR